MDAKKPLLSNAELLAEAVDLAETLRVRIGQVGARIVSGELPPRKDNNWERLTELRNGQNKLMAAMAGFQRMFERMSDYGPGTAKAAESVFKTDNNGD